MKVAAIVVSYNGQADLPKCLESLQLPKVDVWVIDNNSSDESASVIESHKPFKFIQSTENLGFGAANNYLLELAKDYDYYLLINQDAYLLPNSLDFLLESMNENKSFGIISPLQFADADRKLDHNFKQYLKQSKKDNTLVEVPFVNAAIWLLSREIYGKVGGFEKEFFHYGEDRDYCNRVRYQGFKIGIDVRAEGVHARQQTMSYTKKSKLSKIKLKSFFTDPNLSVFGSHVLALRSVFGIPKYYIKESNNWNYLLLIPELFFTYLNLSILKGARLQRVKLKNRKRAKVLS